ncbi:MAG TPA: glycosyltransferase family 2 protein [Anaerolineaceae bacterium]|nr:glycosyltransferase family 2 protein [Anaerolineaceae bacterium]
MSEQSQRANPTILALIPAYNETSRIRPVIAQALQFLPVLVVDDGSADATAAVAEEAGAQVVRHAKNQGKGAALKTGYRWALDQGYAAVVMLDADGQHDPNEIPLFLAARRERCGDLIIGARDYKKMPLVRCFTNHIGRWTFSWAMGEYIPDNQSGYRLVSRPLMERLVDSREEGFHFEVEMIMTCVKNSLKLDWVPIQTIYRGESSHINPIEHVPNFFRVVLNARREMQAWRAHRQPGSGKTG